MDCSGSVQALEAARATRGDDPLARRAALERRFSAEECRAALAQDDLRVRAAAKTPHAERLLFTREALEQGSPAAVAAERATRFAAFDVVADLCAGIGLDAIALAEAGRRVVAVERDPLRARLLAHNVAAAGVGDRVRVVVGDATEVETGASAAFLDPDRRPGGRRTRDPAEFDPPASAWEAIAARVPHLLVKLPPAVDERTLPWPRVERVSLEGEAKEARVGTGALAGTATRRALLLPRGGVVEGEGRPWPAARAPRPGDLLLDPDPAVVLAGLVGDAAERVGAAPVHPRIAWLVGAAPAPWARAARIETVMSADPADLRRMLEARGVGELVVRTRGVDDPPERWRARIGTLRGRGRATLAITRGPDDRYLGLSLVDESCMPGAGM